MPNKTKNKILILNIKREAPAEPEVRDLSNVTTTIQTSNTTPSKATSILISVSLHRHSGDSLREGVLVNAEVLQVMWVQRNIGSHAQTNDLLGEMSRKKVSQKQWRLENEAVSTETGNVGD